MNNSPIILKSLIQNNKYPYFFKNENIDDNTYIVQNALDVSNALYIIDVWNKEQYNTGEIDRFIDPSIISYNKYLYNGNNKITKIKVNGGSEDVKVLCYKKNEVVYTSALLKFQNLQS